MFIRREINMKINFEKEIGIKITTIFEGTVEEYALMWLNLTNNARENKNVFYNIENNYKNDVFVLINENNVEEVVDYLKRLGLTILDKQHCTVVIPYVEYGDSDDEFDWEFAKLQEY
jgi:hypothetical protein